MTIQNRIPEGVPTGGQFAAAARREAVVALHDSSMLTQGRALGLGQSTRSALVVTAARNAQAEAESRAVAARARIRTATNTGLHERLAKIREDMTEDRAATLRARLISTNTSGLADRLAAARSQGEGVDRLDNGHVVTLHAS